MKLKKGVVKGQRGTNFNPPPLEGPQIDSNKFCLTYLTFVLSPFSTIILSQLILTLFFLNIQFKLKNKKKKILNLKFPIQ